jgi:RND superfamily putative drug exporter
MRTDFADGSTALASVVLPDGTAEVAADAAARISELPDVTHVDTVSGSYTDGNLVAPPGPRSAGFADGQGAYLTVGSELEHISPRAEALVTGIRELDVGTPTLVTGPSAALVDSKSAIFGLVPLALAIIAVTTFVLLFLMTGSVLVPVKAIVLNVLSLGATFGAMVWIFQQGNLADLLGFTPTGTLDTSVPILMFCIAFGLSMDYEVFLLSRIKEAYDLTGDTRLAVVTGLQRTGRIMTAAAGVLAVTFIAFATSGVTFIKLMGLGLALAILLDATLVRALLVPAFMRLAGPGNWWAPAPLRRLHERFGVSETA